MTADEILRVAVECQLITTDNRDGIYADALIRFATKLLAEPQGEPVAWMSPGKERLEFSRKDTVYGSHTIPLYTAPTTPPSP